MIKLKVINKILKAFTPSSSLFIRRSKLIPLYSLNATAFVCENPTNTHLAIAWALKAQITYYRANDTCTASVTGNNTVIRHD